MICIVKRVERDRGNLIVQVAYYDATEQEIAAAEAAVQAEAAAKIPANRRVAQLIEPVATDGFLIAENGTEGDRLHEYVGNKITELEAAKAACAISVGQVVKL